MTPEKPAPPDEFYVGYAPPMPPHLAAFIRRRVVIASAGVVIAGGLIALGHRPLEGGSFAFGERHAVAGVVAERPYPAIHVDGADESTSRAILLVAPGKHGAESLVHGRDGERMSMAGARIQRAGQTMLEVIPETIVAAPAAQQAMQLPVERSSGQAERVTVRGEIVDTKCFLGVMVPGDGKTHRACASLCLRGGIPPALLVRDRDEPSTLLLLETDAGEPLPTDSAAHVAGTHVEITGLRGQRAGWPTLQSDPATWTRLPSAAATR